MVPLSVLLPSFAFDLRELSLRVDYFSERWANNVIHKKYFYVLRPLLCVEWMRATRSQALPPASWDLLLKEVDLSPELRSELEALSLRKRCLPGTEPLSQGPRIQLIGI